MNFSILKSLILTAIILSSSAYSYDICKKQTELCATFETYDLSDANLDEAITKNGIYYWYKEELKPFMDKAILKKYKNKLAKKLVKPVFEYFILHGALPELTTKEEIWEFSKFLAKFNRLRSVRLDIIEFSIIRWNLTGYYNKEI